MTTLVPVMSQPLGYVGDDNGVAPRFLNVADTVISQYANSPVLLALIDALSFATDKRAAFNAFFDAVWNIDTAVSFGLDIWGRIVGVSRALFVPATEYWGFSESSDAHTFADGVFWGGGSFTPNFLLSDEAYRHLILAKAALNITNAAVPAINAILMALFPGYGNTYARDNNDMTMTFVFGAVPSRVDYAIATQSGVLPKPAGVAFTVETP